VIASREGGEEGVLSLQSKLAGAEGQEWGNVGSHQTTISHGRILHHRPTHSPV